MRFWYTLLSAGICCCALPASAQVATTLGYLESSHVKVFTGTTERSAPWMGGLTSPQFAMADLNKDGKQDLVVYEKFIGNSVRTFINTGTPGAPFYTYAPRYAKNFPPVYTYLKLQDYNCDGIPDLFHRGMTGISVWRGSYNGANELTFNFYKELYYPFASGSINAYIEATDIPSFVDIDHDGDLDFFGFSIQGSVIYWYKNYQVEDGLLCDSIRIKHRSACWGKTQQLFIRKATMAYNCGIDSLAAPAPGTPDEQAPGGPMSQAKVTHGGNTLCFLDYDGDGDYDYLNGNFAFSDIQLLMNGKVQYNSRDSIISQDTLWQANGVRFNMPSFPSAFHLDYDGDGKRDLLLTTHAGPGSKDWNNVWWYRNTGTDAVPQFSFVKDSLLLDNSIDAGSYSHPVFYDYNRDGKPDLFVGSAGYFLPTGAQRGKIQYFQNTSTPGNPQFQFVTDNIANVWASSPDGAIPAFGDVDGDGKDDLLVGRNDGTISFYRNTASSAVSPPAWTLTDLQMKDSKGAVIDVGSGASPVMYDLDKDGRKDLIIGRNLGTLRAYLNKSTAAGVPSLELYSDSLGRAVADPQSFLNGYSAPFIGRVDTSKGDFLLLGSNTGALYLYDGIANGNPALAYNLVSNSFGNVKPAARTAPAIADIDGDGVMDMIVGNINGGLYLYKNALTSGVETVAPVSAGPLNIFPNPASDRVEVRWRERGTGVANLRVQDLTGRSVTQVAVAIQDGGVSLPVGDWTAGMYLLTVEQGGVRATGRFSVVH